MSPIIFMDKGTLPLQKKSIVSSNRIGGLVSLVNIRPIGAVASSTSVSMLECMLGKTDVGNQSCGNLKYAEQQDRKEEAVTRTHVPFRHWPTFREFLKALETTTAMKRRKFSCSCGSDCRASDSSFHGCWLGIVVVWRLLWVLWPLNDGRVEKSSFHGCYRLGTPGGWIGTLRSRMEIVLNMNLERNWRTEILWK